MKEKNTSTKILVVDDEEMIRFAFAQFLKDEGYEPILASDADSGMDLMKRKSPDIIFLDYRLSGNDGLDFLKKLKDMDTKIPVVFMTAFGAMNVAIKAMQLGAYEYLTKPLDLDRIRELIHRILKGSVSLIDTEQKKEESYFQKATDQIIGKSPAMQDVFKMIGLLTTQDVTVLITGESGVGKELVARAIHENSAKHNEPFVAVNCGAMPENLLEAEMFGYEKGAFTGADSQKQGKFEVAGSGTIFLDEIGDLQFSLQVKLLRVLQERNFERVGGNRLLKTDARIIAATNKDLQKQVMLGRFRQDLFYRLHLIQIHLPPLRERSEDIPLLTEHFIRKLNRQMARDVSGMTEEVLERMLAYSWPGNIRELENQIKRAMVLSRDNILSEHLFELENTNHFSSEINMEKRLADISTEYMSEALTSKDRNKSVFDQTVAVVEKAIIHEALQQSRGNQMQAALLLGLHRSTLRKKIKDYGL